MSNEHKIAILLPTRGRTEALDRSLIGLLELADDLDSIQLLLGLDTDDAVGIAHFQNNLQPRLDAMGVDYTAMTFNPMGYGRLNESINELAKNSSADWLFFWNDDAIMETQGWDLEIVKHRQIQITCCTHPQRSSLQHISNFTQDLVGRCWAFEFAFNDRCLVKSNCLHD